MIKKILVIFSSSFLCVLVLGGLLGYWAAIISCAYVLMTVITICVYKWDKHLAMAKPKQSTRVPERSLHILALVCGWPGALIAQQWFRHKSQKRSFIVVLWLTIFINISVLGAAYYWQFI
ncbi:DUF1294 domain-containing protein [Pseudoalteromonas neustonica]|uniref:DUF1294 domain-containing protein n=1 Tax=Pseudoalteromonas neustonica TaxID=1840331 RepID=A0ABU9TX80_9GAMM